MNRVLIIIVFLFTVTVNCQTVELDTIALRNKLDSIEKIIDIKVQAEYKRNPKVFSDPNGKDSRLRLLKFIRQIVKKEWESDYRLWAKKVLTPNEYAYFSKIKFSYDQETGIPVISKDKGIEYDINWLFNFYDSSSLVMSDMGYYEYLYYVTSTEITGIKETPYIHQFYDSSFKNLIMRQVVELATEFYIIMHEFYHLYYGNQKTEPYEKELAADKFAVEKYRLLFKTDPTYVDESEFLSILKDFDSNAKLKQMFIAFEECNSGKLFNSEVTQNDLTYAFLGSHVIEFFLVPDSRYFLTNSDQLELDIKRAEYFHEVSLDALKCKSDVLSFFCCRIRAEQNELEELKKLLKISENFNRSTMKPEIDRYKKLYPKDPAIIAYALGNQYAKERKFDLALTYYQSVNLLTGNSEYSVLCNLLAYEITRNLSRYKDDNKSAGFLENAKRINKITHTIRDSIINVLP